MSIEADLKNRLEASVFRTNRRIANATDGTARQRLVGAREGLELALKHLTAVGEHSPVKPDPAKRPPLTDEDVVTRLNRAAECITMAVGIERSGRNLAKAAELRESARLYAHEVHLDLAAKR